MIACARAILDILFATLWQGGCIALVAAFVAFVAGRRLNAATRFLFFQGALVAIVVVPICATLPSARANAVSSIAQQAGHAGISGSIGSVAVSIARRRVDIALSDRFVIAFVGMWFAGFAAFALRLVLGSLQLARIVRRSAYLSDRSGIGVYVSDDVRVPVAIGFTAPSIIVPSTLAARGGADFECILLHEIAHVRRGDAWINAYERIVHVVLYFNPAVCFVLRACALEREAACDDWAISQSHDLDTYTHVLATFALQGLSRNLAPAYGASGFARATVSRINRLEHHKRNGATTISRYALGGFSLVLLLIFAALTSFAPAIAFQSHTVASPVMLAANGCMKQIKYLDGPAPDMPNVPKGLMTEVSVRVAANGAVIASKIIRSSGNATFDSAVVASATKGKFSPQMQGCTAVAGTYTFLAKSG